MVPQPPTHLLALCHIGEWAEQRRRMKLRRLACCASGRAIGQRKAGDPAAAHHRAGKGRGPAAARHRAREAGGPAAARQAAAAEGGPAAVADSWATADLRGTTAGTAVAGLEGAGTRSCEGAPNPKRQSAQRVTRQVLLQKRARNHTCNTGKTRITLPWASRGGAEAPARTPPRPQSTQIPAVSAPPTLGCAPTTMLQTPEVRVAVPLPIRTPSGRPSGLTGRTSPAERRKRECSSRGTVEANTQNAENAHDARSDYVETQRRTRATPAKHPFPCQRCLRCPLRSPDR